MTSSPEIIRTRFAPSPSGHLHVGGARTALFCWAYAKARNGKFVLRIEDTDQQRSSDAAGMAFLEDLKWLGIDWDEGPEHDGSGGGEAGPYFQSQRLDIYNRYIEQLIEAGRAYPAFETPEDLNAAREEARRAKRNYRYDRASLKLPVETVRQYLDEGRPHVIRLKVPEDQSITFRDEVRGEQTIEAGTIDDFVIRKADGYPTYHFAVVIDDELMGITHVIRAEEHLSNTPKHIALQEALGFRRPVYAHLSVVTNPDGTKMSKRDKDKALRAVIRERKLEASEAVNTETWAWWLGAKDRQLPIEQAEELAQEFNIHLPEINVDDFRRAGYLPDVLVNYLTLLGWSPGGDREKFDRGFFKESFDFDRIVKSAAKFDRDKLLAFNLDALQAMSPGEFIQHYRLHCEQYHPEFIEKLTAEQFNMLAAANHSRAKTLDDTIDSSRFFIEADEDIVYEQTKPVRKALCNGEPSGYDHLERMQPLLADVDDWSAATLESVVKNYAAEHADDKLGKVAQPLRIAISGGVVSPAIFESLAILGKEKVLNRINRCLETRKQLCEM